MDCVVAAPYFVSLGELTVFKSSLRLPFFALRTLVPAAMAVALMGWLPSWVDLAHAEAYTQKQVNQIFGPGGACSNASGALLADCTHLAGLTPEEQSEATPYLTGQSAIDAMAAPVLSTYEQAGQVGDQLASVLAQRRDGSSGLSVSNLAFNGEAFQDGRMSLFEDSAAGTDLDGKLGVFLNGVGGFGSLDSTGGTGANRGATSGFKFNNAGVIAGVDYRFLEEVIAGLSFNWIRTDTDYSDNLGSSLTNSYGLTAYGSWFGQNAYLDWMANWSYNDYDLKRTVFIPAVASYTAEGDNHSNQLFVSLRAGYLVSEMAGFRFGPQARLDVVQVWIESYSESGGAFDLRYPSYDVTSVTTNIGFEVEYGAEFGDYVLTPRIYGLYVHEFENNQQDINANFVLAPTSPITTTVVSPDRNFGRVGAEISLDTPFGISAFVDYEAIVGLRKVESNQFGIGARYNF